MFSPQKIAVVFQYDTLHLEVSGVPFLDGVWAEKIVTFLSIFKAKLHNRLDSASNSSSTEKTRNDLWIGGSTPAWLGENDGKFVHFDESPSHASAGNNVEGCSTNYTFSKYYEDDNLKVILPYVDSAAREICTKTMQFN